MGEETRQEELERGNRDPLGQPRKPSTAREVDDEPAEVAAVPEPRDMPPRDR